MVSDEDSLIALDIAEGECNDTPLTLPVLAQAKKRVGSFNEVQGDKGFGSDEIRMGVWTTLTRCR